MAASKCIVLTKASGSGNWIGVQVTKGRKAMRTREKQESLASILKEWQHIETRGMAQSAAIMEKTRNPVIRMVMEIIQHDSALHHQVQQFIIDSLENRAVSLSVEDLEHVWTAIESHIEAERKTVALVDAARKALSGTRNVVPQFLLSYLANDEQKHDGLLEDLALIKRGMYRSA